MSTHCIRDCNSREFFNGVSLIKGQAYYNFHPVKYVSYYQQDALDAENFINLISRLEKNTGRKLISVEIKIQQSINNRSES